MWKKVSIIGGAFLLVIGLVTSGFVIEDRYNNQEHHDKDLVHERELNSKELEGLEKQVVMNLKQLEVKQEASIKSVKRESDYRYYSGVLEDLDLKIKELEWRRQNNPNDANVREALEYYTQKRVKVKQKLDSLMGN